MRRKIVRFSVVGVIVALAAAQFYRPPRTNPPSDPAASFEALAQAPALHRVVQRSCHDCHSNQTVWPWYSRIAPVSWLIAEDVIDGRAHLNFSEWNRFGPEMSRSRMQEACRQMREGEMPPWYYVRMHPSAGLNRAEVAAACGTQGD